MEEFGQQKISAFDHLYTSNHIRILKIVSGYLNSSARNSLAVYIKFLELQYVFSLTENVLPPVSPLCNDFNVVSLCEEIIPFCNLQEQGKLQNLINLYQNLENIQEMMQMMEMVKDIMPEGFQNGASGMDLSQFSEIFNML